MSSDKTFHGVIDRYNGVTVDSRDEPCDIDQFSPQLITGSRAKSNKVHDRHTVSFQGGPPWNLNSIVKWDEEQKRCIWFKVHIKDAVWVPALANEGFNFHHSRDNFVMMYKWLPKNRKANLPPASHTNLGVGGLVFNDDNEILVVTEKHFEYAHWKLPGGYVERGEDIKDAAIREVKEETGIDAVFESMVTLRHTHNAMFGNSDIYIVVMLKATSTVITKSEEEIKECKWMKIAEYLSHPYAHEFNRFIVKQALELKEKNIKFNLHKGNVKIANWSRDITKLVVDVSSLQM